MDTGLQDSLLRSHSILQLHHISSSLLASVVLADEKSQLSSTLQMCKNAFITYQFNETRIHCRTSMKISYFDERSAQPFIFEDYGQKFQQQKKITSRKKTSSQRTHPSSNQTRNFRQLTLRNVILKLVQLHTWITQNKIPN